AFRSQRFRIANRRSQTCGQAIAPPDDAQANTFSEAVRSLYMEVFLQYSQNGVHFSGRTLPVCGGKREQCQCVDAELRRAPDNAPSRFRPGAVTLRAWQPSFSGPAAVTIANDRDMHLDGRICRQQVRAIPNRVFHEPAASSAANVHNVLCNAK